MKRRTSRIVVASGMASSAALAIAWLPFDERPSVRLANPTDVDQAADATVVVRPASSVAIARIDPPRPTATSPPPADPPTTVPTITEVPTIVPPAPGYILDIPSLGLREPVVAGDQDEIDQGHVTAVDWSSEGYPTSCRPGDGCTVWLAGHRSTHQAVFARLPEITVGDLIEIHFEGHAYAYTVTELVTVPGRAPPSVIRGDLVLQTSAAGDHRVLVYATTVSPP